MTRLPLPSAQIAGLLAVASLLLPAAAHSEEDLHGPYRADAERPLAQGVPVAVRALLPPGSAWPAPLRAGLEDRMRREWPPRRIYGPVHSSLRVWLEYPLRATRQGGEIFVPVVDGLELRVRGRLELPPESAAPRRVVLLIDASSSANARTRFRNADGSLEVVSVLEAERRAVGHLLEQLGDDWLELGVIAFGEGTWPIAPPGTPRESIARRLEEFRRSHPRGEGRTDTVCALWMAWDWLEDTPRGVERHAVLLTDGDLPHSGRFTDCSHKKRGPARETCEARLNQTTCPASQRLRLSQGRSDLKQLGRLSRRLRKKLRISPVVFEPDRSAREYQRLAERTRGQFVQVASAQGIEVALPPLVAGRIRDVRATNVSTGDRSSDLLADQGRFDGLLPLRPGANEIELVVESDRGPAALFRYRIYAEPGSLQRYLAELQQRNRALARRSESLAAEREALVRRQPERGLSVATE